MIAAIGTVGFVQSWVIEFFLGGIGHSDMHSGNVIEMGCKYLERPAILAPIIEILTT